VAIIEQNENLFTVVSHGKLIFNGFYVAAMLQKFGSSTTT